MPEHKWNEDLMRQWPIYSVPEVRVVVGDPALQEAWITRHLKGHPELRLSVYQIAQADVSKGEMPAVAQIINSEVVDVFPLSELHARLQRQQSPAVLIAGDVNTSDDRKRVKAHLQEGDYLFHAVRVSPEADVELIREGFNSISDCTKEAEKALARKQRVATGAAVTLPQPEEVMAVQQEQALHARAAAAGFATADQSRIPESTPADGLSPDERAVAKTRTETPKTVADVLASTRLEDVARQVG